MALGDQELLVILHGARTLLTDPSNWSHRHYAEDEAGRWIPVGSVHATRFNLEGALVKVASRDVREALPAILQLFGQVSPQALGRLRTPSSSAVTHAEALALIDETMLRLSSPPARKQSGLRPRVDVSNPALRSPAPSAAESTRRGANVRKK